MNHDRRQLLKHLPKVDRVIDDPRLRVLLSVHPRALVVDEVRQHLEEVRRAVLTDPDAVCPSYDELVAALVARASFHLLPTVRRCVNAAGIILHTALGRAPLAESARSALVDAVTGYATLQLDLETGKRGDRHAHVESLLRRLTGAEAAIVVNNNAAATLLLLNTLAEGKEVVISRGELVEIGGSFRIPEVMRRSGALLVEVGTTNRTHLRDYKEALSERTGLLLKVHQSNYRIVGFTSEVPIGELAALAHEHNLPAVDDVGSGALVDLSRWGLPKEPVIKESVAAGADAVCFSGDKLLGGPQCGIIVGTKNVIDRLKRNQLMRALRCDKMTYAVLAATLRLFCDEEVLPRRHPVFRMLCASQADITSRAERLAVLLAEVLGDRGNVTVADDTSEVGSGSLAARPLPTTVIRLHINGMTPADLGRALRRQPVPVVARISDDAVVLDCRTIGDDEEILVADAVSSLLGDR